MSEKVQTCRSCGLDKHEEDFSWRNLGAGGTRRLKVCRLCVQMKQVCWKFGLTEDEYHQLFEDHDHRCGICRQPCSSGRKLAIDHDHDTGKVRGLLCGNCNRGIGNLKEDPKILQRAIDYLNG